MVAQEPCPDEGGEAPCFMHLVDPTLEITDSLLAGALRNLSDAVVIADAGGTIVFWNDAAVRLFGWPASEAIGRLLDLIIPERLRERHWSGFRHTMATGLTSYGDRLLEVPAVHRDGHPLSIAFTVTLLRASGMTQPHAIVAVIRDDTARWQERRSLKAELERVRGAESHSAARSGVPAE